MILHRLLDVAPHTLDTILGTFRRPRLRLVKIAHAPPSEDSLDASISRLKAVFCMARTSLLKKPDSSIMSQSPSIIFFFKLRHRPLKVFVRA